MYVPVLVPIEVLRLTSASYVHAYIHVYFIIHSKKYVYALPIMRYCMYAPYFAYVYIFQPAIAIASPATIRHDWHAKSRAPPLF